MTLRGEGIAEEFTRIVDEYIARRYGGVKEGAAAE